MANVKIIPKIQCDNCGLTVEKERAGDYSHEYVKPKLWGSLGINGGRSDSYGVKSQMSFTDLCPACAIAASDAAADALKARRGEEG
jgi:hypothetical protein